MRNLISLAFMLLGFILFGWGIYASFEIYSTKKQEKMNANFATFFLSTLKNEKIKKLDYPDQGFFIFKSSEGKVSVTDEILLIPMDGSAYISYSKKDPSNTEVYIYVKKYSFTEYVEELMKNPTILGIALSGIIFFLIGVFYMLLQKPFYQAKEVMSQKGKELPSNLENKLKALRLALATHKIIPQESSNEAKKILDDILKEMEGRK
ncbi:hypothetical protein [Thermocrinis sp.]|uniref:hypothetical protein n=1 Tax=Thermocrinis sp. TaxID=2024383 RepID=UPI002FDE86AC